MGASSVHRVPGHERRAARLCCIARRSGSEPEDASDSPRSEARVSRPAMNALRRSILRGPLPFSMANVQRAARARSAIRELALPVAALPPRCQPPGWRTLRRPPRGRPRSQERSRSRYRRCCGSRARPRAQAASLDADRDRSCRTPSGTPYERRAPTVRGARAARKWPGGEIPLPRIAVIGQRRGGPPARPQARRECEPTALHLRARRTPQA